MFTKLPASPLIGRKVLLSSLRTSEVATVRTTYKVLALPNTRARFAEVGAEPTPCSPAEFKANVQAETALFGPVVKARHITPE